MASIFRTLRFRIAMGCFIWVSLFQVALTVLLPIARDSFVVSAVDERLKQVGEHLVQRAQAGTAVSDLANTSTSRDEDPSAVRIQIKGQDGAILAASGKLGSLPTDTPWKLGGRTIEVSDGPGQRAERFRVAGFLAHVEGSPDTYIQTSLSLRAADGITDQLRRMLLMTLGLGLIGSAAAGWVVSGVVVSRVKGIAKAVRDVAPTRLEATVDLPIGNDEIGQMAADVKAMLERMAVAFRSQERFMSEVSHELKTPVSALLAEAQVLKRGTTRVPAHVSSNGIGHDSESVARAVEPYERFVLSVEEEMRWLGKLVESFLMLARFGHGKQFIAETSVQVNEVVLDAVEHSSLYARQHDVNLSLALYDPGESRPEAIVRGDSGLLRVVADNLIRNAVQFSKRGDTVSVRVDVQPGAGGSGAVMLTVKDQGPGVPQEYLTRIFDRFAQAPTKGATRRGSGLGLTIAKGVTDLHGGTIEAKNDPAGGCVFSVCIPVYAPPKEAAGGRA
jgi:signal transduction histidine kinase